MSTVAPGTSVNHGTYAGWNWHVRHKVQMCIACREAGRQYRAARRAANPDLYAAEIKDNHARAAARARLAKLHPNEYRALLADERQKRGLA